MSFKYNFERKFKMKVNDDSWEFYLLTDEECTELDEQVNDSDEGFIGLTLTKEDGSCMFIRETNVTKDIITHELFHLYVSYLSIDSASITTDQFEEMCAEMLQNNLDKFIRIRNKIYKRYKKLEGSN